MSNEPLEIAHQHFSKAYEYQKSRNYRGAYHELKKGLEFEPSSYYGHRTLGIVCGKLMRRKEEAAECYYLLRGYGQFDTVDGYSVFTPRQKVLDSPAALPELYRLMTNLALAEFSVARRKRSAPLLRQCLSSINNILVYAPDYTWIEIIRAWCYIELGDLDTAERILDKCLALMPQVSRTYAVYSRFYFRQGNWKSAAQMTIKGFQVEFDHPKAEKSVRSYRGPAI